MKRVIASVFAAVAAVTFVAPAVADELKLGSGYETTSIDPHHWAGFQNMMVGLSIFGHLVNYDSSMRMVPGLATSWKPLDDMTWEIKLRDTKWHDGTPFTAEDVIFTFARAPNIGLKQFGIYTRGKTITKVDDRTVHIKTETPDPLAPNSMAAFAIVSKKNTEGAATADFNTGKAAVGIGPFKFGEWVKGDRLVLEANPDYWGEKFGWDRLIWKPISSEGSRVAALLSGDVDFIDRVPVVDIPKLKQNPKLTVTQTPSCRTMFLHPDQGRDISPYLMTNDGKPMFPNPMRDQRVRKAMSKAIDRQAIVERVLAGHGVVASQHPPSTLFGHDPNIMVEAYDPQGAKALLKQAGYGDGFQLTIHGTNNRYDNDGPILEAIAQMLTQVGITTKVESMPASVFFKKLFQLEFSLAMAGNCPGMADAGSVLKEFIISHEPAKGYGVYNAQRYSNFRTDEIIKEALATIDNTKRVQLYHEALEIAFKDVAIIPLHHQVNTWASRKGVTYEARTDEMTLPYYAKKD